MLSIVYRRADEILPAHTNPKLHDVEAIASSIDRLGFFDPVLEDGRTGRLIAGHGRLEALALLWSMDDAAPPDGIDLDTDGTWMVPVTVGWSSRDDAEADVAIIGVNQLVLAGGFDRTVLDAMLAGLAEQGTSMEGLGFSEDYLAVALGEIPRSFDLIVQAASEADRAKVAAYARQIGAEARYLTERDP